MRRVNAGHKGARCSTRSISIGAGRLGCSAHSQEASDARLAASPQCRPARVPSARRRRAAAGVGALCCESPVPRGLRPHAVQRVAAPARAVRPLRPAHRRGPADVVLPGPRLRRLRNLRRGAARSTNCPRSSSTATGRGPGNDRASSERPRHRRGAGRGWPYWRRWWDGIG